MSLYMPATTQASPFKRTSPPPITTRQPRDGELDGREYHFVCRESMLKLVEEGEFLEHANVHSNIYRPPV